MIRLSPLDATITRNRGSGLPFRNSSLITRHSSLATAVKFFAFHTLAHSFALFCIGAKLTRFFQSLSHSLFKKHGGGYALHPYFVTSLLIYARNGNALPAAMGSCEKAHRLQERRSCPALNQLSGGGGGGASGPRAGLNEHLFLPGGYRVVRGHRATALPPVPSAECCQRVRPIAKNRGSE